MTNNPQEMALEARAIGMQAYRDSSHRLWISFPDDRLPYELRIVADALAEHTPRGSFSENPDPTSLLLRVLSWADRAGVSVRNILRTVGDGSGPDEQAIDKIENLVASLRLRTTMAATSGVPAATLVPTISHGFKERAKSAPPFDPVLATDSPALAPNARSEIYPTPSWLVDLLSRHIERDQPEPAIVPQEAGDGSTRRTPKVSSLLEPAMEVRADEVTGLLDSLAGNANPHRPEGPHLVDIERDLRPTNKSSGFRDLIYRIGVAVDDARDAAPGDVPELGAVEDLLRLVREWGVEAYARDQHEAAERIMAIGNSILARIEEIGALYRGRRKPMFLQRSAD